MSRIWRAGAIALLAAGSAQAASYAWNRNTAGSHNWNAAANWLPNSGFPNAQGDVANITGNATGHVTNVLNQATITVGVLNIGDSDTATRRPFCITGTSGQVLIFDHGAEPAQLNQTATSSGDTIAAPVQVTSALVISSATPDRTLVISGELSGGPGAALSKTGRGTVQLAGANTFSGSLAVLAGTLTGVARTSGSPFGSGSNAITIGGSDPLSAGYAPILTLSGLSAATTTECGDVTASGRFNSGYLSANASAGGTTALQAVNLTRTAGATLVVQPRNTGSLATDEKVLFSGSGTALASGILPPWLVVGLNGGDFASYGADGIQRAAYAWSSFDSSLATQVVNLAAAASLSAPQTAYAVRMAANLNLNGNTLTLGNGGIGGLILLNNTTLSNSGGPASVDSGAAELAAYVDGANSATIGAPLTGTGTFTKFGTGTLTLTHPSLPEDIALPSGTLVLNPTASFEHTGSVNGNGTLYKDGTAAIALSDSTCTLGGAVFKQGTVALSSTVVTNLTTLSLGPTASGTFPPAAVVITNGSRWVQVGSGMIIGNANTAVNNLTANGHSMVVRNATVSLGGDLIVGAVKDGFCRANNNSLLLDDATITNAAAVCAAFRQGGDFNRIVLTNGARISSTSINIGGGAATLANGGGSSNSVVIVDGSRWHNTGSLSVGTTGGGTQSIGNSILADGPDVEISGVTTVSIGNKLAQSGSPVRYNRLILTNGAQLVSSSTATIGSGHNAASSCNGMHVSQPLSKWAGNGDLTVNYGAQGPAVGNLLMVDQGASVTGMVRIWVGRANAALANEGRLIVTNGGSLFSRSTVIIGYAHDQGSGLPSHSNLVSVVGGPHGPSLWNLANSDLYIGYVQDGADSACKSFGNAVRVGTGGTITAIDDIVVGTISANPNNPTKVADNRLEIAGGACSAARLTVRANNALAPMIGASGFTALSLSGTATLAAGSLLSPSAAPGTPGGTYTVLTAASVTDSGMLLDPAVDAFEWDFAVSATAVTVTYRPRGAAGTVILLR